MCKWIKSEDGFIAISAIMVMAVFIVIGVFSLQIYTYTASYKHIFNEVNTLSDVVAKYGGLPDKEVDIFKERVLRYGFIDNTDNISITALTDINNIDCIGVADMKEDGFYIDNEDQENIILKVKVPANSKGLLRFSELFTTDKVKETYDFERRIISKREPMKIDEESISEVDDTEKEVAETDETVETDEEVVVEADSMGGEIILSEN